MKKLHFLFFAIFVSVLFFNCQNETNTSSSNQATSHEEERIHDHHDHNHGDDHHGHDHHHDDEVPITVISDYGKIENQIYSNQLFDFQIQIPESWHVIDQEAMAKATEQGMDLVEENEDGSPSEAERIANSQLLNISQFPITSDVANNSTLMITADNIAPFPEIQNGKNYLEHTKETFQAMGMEIEIIDDVSEKTISNRKFHQLEIKINFGDGSISQQYISAVVKDYIFNIVLTYGNEESKMELEKILNSYHSLSS